MIIKVINALEEMQEYYNEEANTYEFYDIDLIIFNYDLNRHIRFHYPSVLYNETYFEIDDEGNPYWVVPTYKNEITLYQGGTPTGTIIVNPVNGDIDRYKLGEEPS